MQSVSCILSLSCSYAIFTNTITTWPLPLGDKPSSSLSDITHQPLNMVLITLHIVSHRSSSLYISTQPYLKHSELEEEVRRTQDGWWFLPPRHASNAKNNAFTCDDVTKTSSPLVYLRYCA